MLKTAYKKPYKRLPAIIIATVAAIAVLCIAIKKGVAPQAGQLHALLTPHSISLNFEHMYQPELEMAIRTFVASYTNKSLLTFNPIDFYQQLKTAFPIIKKIEWNFSSNQNLHVTIQGTKPYCLVNNNYVLGDKKRLFSKNLFNEESISALPHITVDNRWLGEKINEHVFTFIHTIPSHYWGAYNIRYASPHNISLIPHMALCRCRIVTTEKTFFNKSKFQALSSVFNDLCQKQLVTTQMLNSKKSIVLSFDFRIRNQIIVRFCEPSKRGKGL